MSDLAGDNGLPLAGIRVADFGWILAAPHATAWLGALGADVIRIENPRHVDIARFLGGTDGKMGVNRGGGFHAINFSKRSIALDLSTAAGAEIAQRLVAVSDIAVENFATGTMRRFGLDYENTARRKARFDHVVGDTAGADGAVRGGSRLRPAHPGIRGSM